MFAIFWDNLLETCIVSVVVFLLSYNYVSREPWRQLPPGPWSFPLIGSLPFLGADMRKPLLHMGKKYGDVFTVYLGVRRCIILNGHDVIKEALVKHSHAFSGRPSIFFIEEITRGLGVVSTQGEFWKKQRRFAHTVLKDFGFGRSLMEAKIGEEVAAFLTVLDRTAGQPLDFYNRVQMAVANIIGSVSFGDRFDYEDPKFKNYLKMMVDGFDIVGNSGFLNVFPYLRFLPGDLFKYKMCMETTEFMKSEFREMIQKHKDAGIWGDEPTDFVDAFLRAMEEQEGDPDSTFSVDQLVAVVSDLFGAGTETTTTTLTWMAIYLLHHPDVQEKICQEIDDVIGSQRAPSMSDKSKMAYTEATLCELQRLADTVPFSVPHGTSEDVWFRGYFIPKGSYILPNLNSAHRDPDLWPQPEKFDPTRFLDEDGKFKKQVQLIPFSVGPRVCLGEGLARMELFLFVTSILQRFTLTLPPGHPLPNLTGRLGITNIAPKFKVILQHR